MSDAVLAASLSAMGSIVGASTSAASASEINKRGEKYARWATQYTTEQNQAEAKRNRDWQEAMVDKYYTIQAQRQQYEAAGLNPNMMAGASTGTSSSGSYGATQAYQPSYSMNQSGQILSSGIAQAANVYANTKLSDSQARLNMSNVTYNYASMADRLENLYNQSKISEVDYQKAKGMLSLDLSIRSNELQQSAIQTDVMRISRDSMQFQLSVDKWRFTSFSDLEIQKYKIGILQDMAQLSLTAAQEKWTEAKTKHELNAIKTDWFNAISGRINANAAKENADTNRSLASSQETLNYAMAGNQTSQSVLNQSNTVGVQIDNKQKLRINDLVVNSMSESYKLLQKQNNMYYIEHGAAAFRDIGIGVGSVVDVAGKVSPAKVSPIGFH